MFFGMRLKAAVCNILSMKNITCLIHIVNSSSSCIINLNQTFSDIALPQKSSKPRQWHMTFFEIHARARVQIHRVSLPIWKLPRFRQCSHAVDCTCRDKTTSNRYRNKSKGIKRCVTHPKPSKGIWRGNQPEDWHVERACRQTHWFSRAVLRCGLVERYSKRVMLLKPKNEANHFGQYLQSRMPVVYFLQKYWYHPSPLFSRSEGKGRELLLIGG